MVGPLAFDHPERVVAGRLDNLALHGEGHKVACVVVFVGLNDTPQHPLAVPQVIAPGPIATLDELDRPWPVLRRDWGVRGKTSLWNCLTPGAQALPAGIEAPAHQVAGAADRPAEQAREQRLTRIITILPAHRQAKALPGHVARHPAHRPYPH